MQDRTLVSLLRFDVKSEQLIHEETSAIRRVLGRESNDEIGPHVSLIPSNTRDEVSLIERLQTVATRTRAFELRFSHLGWFPGGVLFLGATPTAELINLHQRIYGMSDAGPDTQWLNLYEPGSWVPHCTLAVGVPDDMMSDALAEAAGIVALPMDVRCTAIELVEIDSQSIRTLQAIPLPDDSD